MEDVLDLYHEPYDAAYPVVCFDEGTKQLIGETRSPLPMEPGQPHRYDYEYERHGTCNLFTFCEPLAAWRHVEVTDQRRMIEYAHCMKFLVDERYSPPFAQFGKVCHIWLKSMIVSKLPIYGTATCGELAVFLLFYAISGT